MSYVELLVKNLTLDLFAKLNCDFFAILLHLRKVSNAKSVRSLGF